VPEDSKPETTATKPGVLAPPDLLRKPSDQAVRPGFRSPANKNSKAQKGGKKGR
jgi:hypothetical protein